MHSDFVSRLLSIALIPVNVAFCLYLLCIAVKVLYKTQLDKTF